MILLSVKIIKILIVLLSIAVIWIIDKRYGHNRLFLCTSLFILFFAVIGAMYAADITPTLTDTITVTALEKKDGNVQGGEIIIEGFTIDGKQELVRKVLDGKWFWIGDTYCWRDESDPRQPDGTTKSIKLAVPVGWGRTIDFRKGNNGGLVQVDVNGKTEYLNTAATDRVKLGRSRTIDLILNQLIKLIAFTATIFFTSIILLFIRKRLKQASYWAIQHKWHLLYAGIALLQLLFAIHYSDIDSLWLDEVMTIGFVLDSSNLKELLLMGDTPMPLNMLISAIVYRISPYGEKWLLLPTEIMTAVGIYFAALCAKRCRSGLSGIFTAFFLAISSTLLFQVSYEFRMYAFFFSFASIFSYFYICRLDHMGQETWKETAIFSIVMLLYAQAHYHAVIRCIMIFGVDAYLFLKKKIRKRCFIPYFIAAAPYIPIVAIAFLSGKAGWNYTNHTSPSIESALSLLLYLVDHSKILLFFFTVGATYALVLMGLHVSKRKRMSVSGLKTSIPLYLIFSSIAFFYIYGKMIRPEATLWIERYFVDLSAFSAIITGIGASLVCEFIAHSISNNNVKVYASICILAFIFQNSYTSLLQTAKNIREPYRQAADWLYTQGDYIYNEDTLVLLSTTPWHFPSGWNDYYITQQGRRDPINVISQNIFKEDDFSGYNTIYLVYIHYPLSDTLRSALDNAFDLEATHEDIKVQVYTRK